MKIKWDMGQVVLAVTSVLSGLTAVTPMLPETTPVWIRLSLMGLSASLGAWAHAVHTDTGKP